MIWLLEFQQIAVDHSADIDYKDALKIYSNCKREPYSLLSIDTTTNNSMRFRKNFSDYAL